MRYILNDECYISEVSFSREIECNNKSCIEYTGSVPTGYTSLTEWNEKANINAYKVVNGELTYDSAKDAELQSLWASQMQSNSTGDTLPIGSIFEYDGETVPDGYEEVSDPNQYSNEEKVVGTWINGKPIYRKVLSFSKGDFTYNTMHINHNIQNIDVIVTQKCNWYDSAAERWRAIPSNYYGTLDWATQLGTSSSQISFELGDSALTRIRDSATQIYVTLEYTKTTD